MKYLFASFIITLLFTACQPLVKPENLYGKWKYVRVQHPNAATPDSIGSETLQEQKPYIQFTTKDSLFIYWDGKLLSHGTFKLDDHNIQYKEILEDGKIREFPFYIENFTAKQLVFSTKGTDGSEVTAVKQ